ncbi:MAG: CdaR family protein [Armatimonadota bacterium]|nr:CdaR family protein [Armatimonadota bacterium]
MRDNLGYKLLALFLAVVLWAKVNGDRNPNIKTPIGYVTVEYTRLPLGLIVTEAPARIQVSATGPQSALRSLAVSQLKATADLSDAQPGTQEFAVDISAPPDLAEKVGLSPTEIKVKLETLERKSLKIDVSLQGVPPLGYSFGPASAYPPAAVVSGRSSLVSQVRRLNIAVSSGAAQSEGDDYYPVVALDAAGNEIKGLTIEPSRVSAKLGLVEAQATKSVIISPDIVGQPMHPLKVTAVNVSPNVVTIFGRPGNIARISTIGTDPIDITNATSDVTRTVGLRAPPDVRSTDIRSVKVTVRISQ